MPVIAKDAIIIWIGHSQRLEGVVDQADGSDQNLTGATVYFIVGKTADATGADVLLSKVVTIVDASTGAWALDITPADTSGKLPGRHRYQVSVRDGAGNLVPVNVGPCVFQKTMIPPA